MTTLMDSESLDATTVRQGSSVNGTNHQSAEENKVTLNVSDMSAVKVGSSKGYQKVLENERSMGWSDQKRAMLGKKRDRKMMFLDVGEAAKQTFPPVVSTTKMHRKVSGSSVSAYRRQGNAVKTPVTNTAIDLTFHDSQNPTVSNDGVPQAASRKPERAGSMNESSSALVSDKQNAKNQAKETKLISSQLSNAVREKYLQQGTSIRDEKLAGDMKSAPRKNLKVSRKQFPYSHDSSIERLHREVTSDKLWLSHGDAELQSVPGSFASVQEYVSVFEPLLFEECRAQLRSTWDELSEGATKSSHAQVYVKSVERSEKGWYDLVLMPLNGQIKAMFKEGDVAILSSAKPGSGNMTRQTDGAIVSDVDAVSNQVAGIIRRYIPIDIRDVHGAVFHFYADKRKISEETIFRKYETKGFTWYLTVLGPLATTQREYVALHAVQNLKPQMINAILNPKPELFPHYDKEPPAMPDCFTQPFVQHLHANFNNPQLTAIKWAAMHTAAGSHNISTPGKYQVSWPFTLVQGPPGTGKTHTVWGMLNVIHLVQYQRYYTSLLKKLAPECLNSDESNESNTSTKGDLDDLLRIMGSNLARILPKLCPKPRMLVCAPSNAATDELLSRVLERGFVDGEMKVYRPDVARVGVDTQTRASQAVSVERRSENILGMCKDDVLGWLQQLHAREKYLGQQVACLQRELSAATAAAHAQGSVGVDPDVLSARDQMRDTKLQQLAAIVEERDKVIVEISRLNIVERYLRNGLSLEDARMKLEGSFANEAEIVFTTVSSSGRRIFNQLAHGFDMVVIDEAAQASEVAILPPLSLGAARCVLIGDPQQLPATVISRAAHTLQYSRSLFERFQQGGCPTMLLSVQYRMHPQIREFPSRYFYQGRLVDSESVAKLPDELYHQTALLRPYLFYDVSHGRESHKGSSVSYQNVTEAHFAARLYLHLRDFIKSAGIGNVSVGVITPYKLQLRCLQQEFGSILGPEANQVYINTVDAFQGQERDVIIISCVRASSYGVGFVADIRRMNVALTRARRSLWVIGNAAALSQSEDWAALLADAKRRGCFVAMDAPRVRGLLN